MPIGGLTFVSRWRVLGVFMEISCNIEVIIVTFDWNFCFLSVIRFIGIFWELRSEE